jgi:hypothetical protein
MPCMRGLRPYPRALRWIHEILCGVSDRIKWRGEGTRPCRGTVNTMFGLRIICVLVCEVVLYVCLSGLVVNGGWRCCS